MAAKPSMPPPWIIILSLLLYLALLAGLVLLPGPSLLERLRWLDSGICAQMATHTFYPGGEPLPLCARNTGIYLGFIVSLALLHITGKGHAQQLPPGRLCAILVSGVILLALDGLNSLALDLGLPHLYQPHNLLRLASGLVTGLALAALSLPIINRLLWCEYSEQRSISSWSALFPFIFMLIICFFAVASQNIVVLYPLALLSTAGLLSALSIVNLLVIITISKREETFEHYLQLLPLFSIALLLSIGEMLILAQLKLALLHALGL
ncbi:DUF2085 domain-containing protein [Ktedonosporobacter rubrisoli]|nr:DUF2085 domain-containing protein [Ktedonosporobacter rubrisoli]